MQELVFRFVAEYVQCKCGSLESCNPMQPGCDPVCSRRQPYVPRCGSPETLLYVEGKKRRKVCKRAVPL